MPKRYDILVAILDVIFHDVRVQINHLSDFGEVGLEWHALSDDVKQFDRKVDHVAQTQIIARILEEGIVAMLQVFKIAELKQQFFGLWGMF